MVTSALHTALRCTAAAVRLLTTIPAPQPRDPRLPHAGYTAACFPLAGLLLAVFPVLLLQAVGHLRLACGAATPPSLWLEAILCLSLLTVLTGGLHLDGLADTFDGLGAGPDRSRALTIMRDSRIGSFGVCALILDLALKCSLLVAISPPFFGLPESLDLWALALSLLSGRWAMTMTCAAGRYAREDTQGLGATFAARTGWHHASLAALVPIGLALASPFPAHGLAGVCAAGAASLAFTWWCTRRLGGVTGDTMGAANEIGEAGFLFFLYLVR